MKKLILLALLISLIAIVSACGNNSVQTSTPTRTIDQAQNYHVGDLIYKGSNAFYAFYFGGIVYDSIVINEVKNVGSNNSYTLPLNVSMKKNHIVRLNAGNTTVTVKILDVDRDDDSATLIVSKEE